MPTNSASAVHVAIDNHLEVRETSQLATLGVQRLMPKQAARHESNKGRSLACLMLDHRAIELVLKVLVNTSSNTQLPSMKQATLQIYLLHA